MLDPIFTIHVKLPILIYSLMGSGGIRSHQYAHLHIGHLSLALSYFNTLVHVVVHNKVGERQTVHVHTTRENGGRKVYYLDTSYTLLHQNNREYQVHHHQLSYSIPLHCHSYLYYLQSDTHCQNIILHLSNNIRIV